MMIRIAVLWGVLISLTTVVFAVEPDATYNRQWAEKAFSFQPVSRLNIIHEDVQGDTKPGLCSGKGPLPIRLGDKVYQHGIGVNSQSTLRVSLDRPAKKILAIIGLDRNVDKTAASIRFHVRIGEKDAFATEIMRADSAPQSIDVPLGGAKEFDLIVDDAGDGRGWDQGDWADAKVVLEDSSEQWLDEISTGNPLPFSFIYGGKHSSEFINSWKTNIVDDELSTTIHRHTLTATDPQTGLEVRAVCLIYLDTAGVDWTVYFTNKGNMDTPVIEQVKAIDVSVLHAVTADTILHRLNGAPCKTDDWMPFDQPIPDGQRIEFSAAGGRSSNVSPWFTTDWGNGGVITAIGWSGQWSAAVESKGNQAHIEAGMQNLHAVLHPGESLRSPRILQLHWQGKDSYYAYNQFRQTMFAHIMPRINGQIVVPPITHLSTSFYEQNDTNETNLLSHLESIRGLGFEMFWLDAYWTGPNGFPDSMGNYGFPLERVEPKDRFPHGLSTIADAVEKEGLRFLLWFEPERVAKGTLLTKEHPEWILSPSGDGSGLFNLGIPEARQYMTDYLNAAIKKYKLSCLRIDYNIDPLGYWQFMDTKDPNRIGMTEMHYVEGLYRMWDDILAANPSICIDNCASGGRRIDVETMSRSIPLWRSDNTCDMLDLKPATVLLAAIKNQTMSTGLNRYVPFSLVGQKGATPYLFRSGYNGGIDIADDLRPNDYPRDLLKQGITEAKRLRKYFFGNFYPLYESSTSPREWCVMQYHRPNENDGMIMAFRREQSPFRTFECQLREIDPTASYEVTLSHTYQPENPETMKGSDLQNLKIEITDSPGSLIVEYRPITESGKKIPGNPRTSQINSPSIDQYAALPTVDSVTAFYEEITPFKAIFQINNRRFLELAKDLKEFHSKISHSGIPERDILSVSLWNILTARLAEYVLFIGPKDLENTLNGVIRSPVIDGLYLKEMYEKKYSIKIDRTPPEKINQYGMFYSKLGNDLTGKTPKSRLSNVDHPLLRDLADDFEPIQFTLKLAQSDSLGRLLDVLYIIAKKYNRPIKDISKEEFMTAYEEICQSTPDLIIMSYTESTSLKPLSIWDYAQNMIKIHRVIDYQ